MECILAKLRGLDGFIGRYVCSGWGALMPMPAPTCLLLRLHDVVLDDWKLSKLTACAILRRTRGIGHAEALSTAVAMHHVTSR